MPLWLIAGGLAIGAVGLRSAADDRAEVASAQAEARFKGEVRPFLERYCLGCHGKDKPKGELDLSAFTTAQAVANDLPHWQLVQEQLEAGSMPPAKAKQRPAAEARRAAHCLDRDRAEARGDAQHRRPRASSRAAVE